MSTPVESAAPVVESATEAAPVESQGISARLEDMRKNCGRATKAVAKIAKSLGAQDPEFQYTMDLLKSLPETLKDATKTIKMLEKTQRKRKSSSGNPTKSGIVMIQPLSSQMTSFLGIPAETQLSRVQVIKELVKYIDANNLKKESNRRLIDFSKPGGEKLRELLGCPADVEITHFSMQRYLNPHLLPRDKPAASPVVEAPAPVAAAPVPEPTKQVSSNPVAAKALKPATKKVVKENL